MIGSKFVNFGERPSAYLKSFPDKNIKLRALLCLGMTVMNTVAWIYNDIILNIDPVIWIQINLLRSIDVFYIRMICDLLTHANYKSTVMTR